MIAAIYARKSTDQSGVAEEQKSVARQIEHARAYALKKGLTRLWPKVKHCQPPATLPNKTYRSK